MSLGRRRVLIAHHLDGKPLEVVDAAAMIGPNSNQTRVRYATNTGPGSSGAPVFDLNWNLIAMHHMSEPVFDRPRSYSQGIPIERIRDRLRRMGYADLLDSESP